MGTHSRNNSPRSRRRARKGALMSFELLMVLPILVGLLLATVEFSLLLQGNCRLKEACRLACRVAARPCDDPVQRNLRMRETIEQVLQRPGLLEAYRLTFEPGLQTGDPVVVELTVPMNAAAPNVLAVLGFDLSERELVTRTVMHKE